MTKWIIADVGKNASKVKRALRVRHGWKNLRMVVMLGGMGGGKAGWGAM